jgi:addiction module HigA family antidote
MAMKNPPHPGRIIKEDCLPELKLTAGAAAKTLGVSRQTLDKIMNGRSSITPDMAIRFEKAFGINADTLMRMQTAFDMAQARARADVIIVDKVLNAA